MGDRGGDYGPLIGLDLATGKQRWRFEPHPPRLREYGTIAGDTLFIGTSFPSEGAVDPPVVYALDLATGRQRWRTVLDRGTDLQWAAPVVHGEQVLVADTLSHPGSASTSHLYALDAGTGQLRWKADLHADQQGFFAEPPVVAGGLVYVATASRRLLALEVDSGREVWRTSGFPVIAGVRNGLVLAVLEDRLAALDAGSGVRRWEVPVSGAGSTGRSWRATPSMWRRQTTSSPSTPPPGRRAGGSRSTRPSVRRSRPGGDCTSPPGTVCSPWTPPPAGPSGPAPGRGSRTVPWPPQTAWWSPPPTAPCSGSLPSRRLLDAIAKRHATVRSPARCSVVNLGTAVDHLTDLSVAAERDRPGPVAFAEDDDHLVVEVEGGEVPDRRCLSYEALFGPSCAVQCLG